MEQDVQTEEKSYNEELLKTVGHHRDLFVEVASWHPGKLRLIRTTLDLVPQPSAEVQISRFEEWGMLGPGSGLPNLPPGSMAMLATSSNEHEEARERLREAQRRAHLFKLPNCTDAAASSSTSLFSCGSSMGQEAARLLRKVSPRSGPSEEELVLSSLCSSSASSGPCAQAAPLAPCRRRGWRTAQLVRRHMISISSAASAEEADRGTPRSGSLK
eukprot:CAMPEP_0180432678 /NCGR_PEP_ID=MMETSP1036_2-20121128/9035_1 /TAXON_ID=632150 /ORGANISM="Azadinium spinosum, Strain 3D9" /LENGTH=214 /DNA_ID=CAMNT_0022438471 /DNA_START=568 /DNA_END=1214 /DNA_ORIENTATION=-